MGLRELLDTAGLLDQFEAAQHRGDREAMTQMLVAVNLSQSDAQKTVTEIFRREWLDAQRNALDCMSLTELGDAYMRVFGRPTDLAIGAANIKELILTEHRLYGWTATKS